MRLGTILNISVSYTHLGLRILRGVCEKAFSSPPPKILIHHILNYPQKVLFLKRDLYYLENVRKIPLDDAWSLSIRFFLHHVALHELIMFQDLFSLVNKFSQSVQFSCSVVSDSLWTPGWQQAKLPCLSPTPKACSHSCPSGRWCHPTISSSVILFSSFNISQHKDLFQWISSSNQVAKLLEFQLQHQSFQWIFRTVLL